MVNKSKLLAYSNSQLIRKVVEYPNRGNIVDRNGHPLAINIHVYNLFTIPKKKDFGFYQDLKKLAKIVPQLTFRKLKSMVRHRKKYTWLARNVRLSEEQYRKIRKLENVFLESHSQRVYPNKELLSQVLGFVGVDNIGLGGLENSMDEELKGQPQIIKYVKDAKGRPVKYESKIVNTESSRQLILSIDKDIQSALEVYLKESVLDHQAIRGGAGVMDVETGEIIALANYPSYDPNRASSFPSKFRKLSFVTDPFEPGSILKSLTIAAALENKVANPETRFFCEKGQFKVQNHWISEAESHEKFEWLSLGDILKFSSNIGTTKVAFALKAPKLINTFKKFGLNEKTGLEIHGESKGIFPFEKKQKVSPLSLSNISFGQGVATTAIQMLRAYAVFANGGYLVKPTFFKTQKSQLVEEKRIISKKTADQITSMLQKVVSDGTGGNAKIPHYDIAGKTGTAQRVSSSGGYSGYIGSFIGYPVNVHKKFVVLAYVDHPTKKGYYGGVTAAPIFKKITQYILYKKKDFTKFAKYNESSNAKNLDFVQTKQASLLKTKTSKISKSKKGSAKNLSHKVTATTSFLNSSIQKTILPDFSGMDKTSVMKFLDELSLEAEFIGFGVAIKQFPQAGTELKNIKKMKIHFKPPVYAE